MSAVSSCVTLLLLQLSVPPALVSASAEAFTVQHKGGSLRASIDAAAFETEIQTAMGEALGCGGQVEPKLLRDIEDSLLSMYRALPKNRFGRIDRRSLRHLAHRYFNQNSAMVVRGFEPSRPVNESSWGSAEILSQKVPGYVEAVLMSRHVEERGFDIQDASQMIATIEQLIYDSESALLEKVYQEQGKPKQRGLSVQGLRQVLEDYLVHWLMGDDAEGIKLLLSNRSLLESAFPNWDQLADYAKGEIKALDYKRLHASSATSSQRIHSGGNALLQRYSFEDANSVVGGITKSFASFWESECAEMKVSLVAMDSHRTGRVPLSKFYGTGLDAEWRFGESEAYLRELGALDETSSWGKQVIIPNYIQAASNCIVTTSHYMLCCANDCNPIISEIEVAVGAATADVDQLLALVQNMTSMTSLEDEADVRIDAALSAQLSSIAVAHGGQVPLHSRLFLQWLHYVFPRECPFPHKTGTVASVAPLEFQGNYVATRAEMKAHSALDENWTNITAEFDKDDMQWMSQWSEEEELITGHAGRSDSTWSYSFAVLGLLGFSAAAMRGVIGLNRKGTKADFLLPTHRKAHFV